jgi:hypothetical protein
MLDLHRHREDDVIDAAAEHAADGDVEQPVRGASTGKVSLPAQGLALRSYSTPSIPMAMASFGRGVWHLQAGFPAGGRLAACQSRPGDSRLIARRTLATARPAW